MKILSLFLLTLICFIPINSVILKQEASIIAEQTTKPKDERLLTNNGGGSDILVLFLILILVYMIFNAPVWGIALITAPFIFSSANSLFGNSTANSNSSGTTGRKLKNNRGL